MKHTQGPWREGVDGNNRVYGPDAMGEATGLIAVVYKGRGNIKLIAAAPDMYLALCDMVSHCYICDGTGKNRDAMDAWDIPGAPVPDCYFCSDAREALEKAGWDE
jgi:hypothetical protein